MVGKRVATHHISKDHPEVVSSSGDEEQQPNTNNTIEDLPVERKYFVLPYFIPFNANLPNLEFQNLDDALTESKDQPPPPLPVLLLKPRMYLESQQS